MDDHRQRIPEAWMRRGGVMLPMYQSEAMWLNFSSPSGLPFAVKVATGKINAVTAEAWSEGIHRDPQDYYPLKRKAWERILAERAQVDFEGMPFSLNEMDAMPARAMAPDMGLAAGGRMRQEIYEDEHAFEDWDLRRRSRCFVHIANSLAWKGITGSPPPTEPPTTEDYTRAGLP